jgi:hypothetical protein
MPVNFGALCDQIYDKNDEIAQLNAKLKELEGEKREVENQLLAAMQDAGTDIVRGTKATVSISTTIRPQLADYEEFVKFVLRRKACHLFERRVSSKAYQEMKESLGNKPIPGITEFPQVRLNIRKV